MVTLLSRSVTFTNPIFVVINADLIFHFLEHTYKRKPGDTRGINLAEGTVHLTPKRLGTSIRC